MVELGFAVDCLDKPMACAQREKEEPCYER